MKTLIEIFSSALMQEKPYEGKPGFKIKPSSLGSPCLRKSYYEAAQVKPDYPFDLSGKRRMALGEAIHDMLRDNFLKAKVLIDYYLPGGEIAKDQHGNDNFEFPLKMEDLYIRKAFIDAVFVIDGQLWLGEYKSINLKGFTALMNPKSDHMIQGVTYLYVFNRMLAEGAFSHIEALKGFTKAEGVIFLYINKDDTTMKEFAVREADEFFGSIVKKIMDLKDAYDSKTLPPKTIDWCQTCSFRDKCKNNFNIS